MKRLLILAMLIFGLSLSANAQVAARVTVHSITLSWTITQGSDPAVGVNVWRGTVSAGPYTKLNATPIPITTFTYADTTGVGGTLYYYVATTVDAMGITSPNSNQVSGSFIVGQPNAPNNLSITVTASEGKK
jgi:fibronectin type 3 domain-containing protein